MNRENLKTLLKVIMESATRAFEKGLLDTRDVIKIGWFIAECWAEGEVINFNFEKRVVENLILATKINYENKIFDEEGDEIPAGLLALAYLSAYLQPEYENLKNKTSIILDFEILVNFKNLIVDKIELLSRDERLFQEAKLFSLLFGKLLEGKVDNIRELITSKVLFRTELNLLVMLQVLAAEIFEEFVENMYYFAPQPPSGGEP